MNTVITVDNCFVYSVLCIVLAVWAGFIVEHPLGEGVYPKLFQRTRRSKDNTVCVTVFDSPPAR